MRYVVRPISDRTWIGSHGKEATRFNSKWTATINLLGREIDLIKGRDVVIEMDIGETDLKLNGELRADARPTTGAVVVAFDTSEHGQLIYQCDRFVAQYYGQGPDWQHNVRAIALHLESQRAQVRWGVTGVAGGTYGGFRALGAGRATPSSHMTRTDAAELLERIAVGDEGALRERSVQRILDAPEVARQVWREARKVTHPDRRGGDHTTWDQVEQAAAALGLLS